MSSRNESETIVSGEIENETVVGGETVERTWSSAIVGGLAGGLAFGVMLHLLGMMPVIGALYGMESAAAGWVAHLFHSVVFGLVYAGVVGTPRFAEYGRRESTGAVAGAVYGAIIWFVAAGFVMPIWMSVLGVAAPPVPNLDPMSLVGHLVYGVILGVVFATMVGRRLG